MSRSVEEFKKSLEKGAQHIPDEVAQPVADAPPVTGPRVSTVQAVQGLLGRPLLATPTVPSPHTSTRARELAMSARVQTISSQASANRASSGDSTPTSLSSVM